MKPRWLDIRIRAKTDMPLKMLRHPIAWQTTMNVAKERAIQQKSTYCYCTMEIHQVTVKVGKEGR